MDNTERIVELDIGFTPEAAVSGAVLVQSDHSTFLTFNAMRKEAGGQSTDAGIALIEFVFCSITKFGYPNDEAWHGIPRTKGLSYGIYEVLNSNWKIELTRLNRHSFPDTKGDSTSRHFLLLFHDSSFECIAQDLRFELVPRSYADVFSSIAKRILAE